MYIIECMGYRKYLLGNKYHKKLGRNLKIHLQSQIMSQEQSLDKGINNINHKYLHIKMFHYNQFCYKVDPNQAIHNLEDRNAQQSSLNLLLLRVIFL